MDVYLFFVLFSISNGIYCVDMNCKRNFLSSIFFSLAFECWLIVKFIHEKDKFIINVIHENLVMGRLIILVLIFCMVFNSSWRSSYWTVITDSRVHWYLMICPLAMLTQRAFTTRFSIIVRATHLEFHLKFFRFPNNHDLICIMDISHKFVVK